MTFKKTIRRITIGVEFRKKFVSMGLFLGLAFAGVLGLQTRLCALANGAPADLELGQPSLTLGYPNTITASGTYSPRGMAVGGGRVYVADTANNRVLWWDAASFATGHAADGVIGQADFTGALPNRGAINPDANTLSAPSGVAVDGTGNVWVADTNNNRVLRFPAPTGSNPTADIVLGQANFVLSAINSPSGTIGINTLYSPQGVALDSLGNIWVADYNNNRALRFPFSVLSGGSADRVLGHNNFTSGTPATSSTGLSGPVAVALDATDNVWIADANNNRVLKYLAPITNNKAAGRVLGQANFTSGLPNQNGSVGAATLSLPQALAVEGANLWVADSFNNRLLRFTNPSANGQAADLALGQAVLTTDLANGAAGTAGDATLNNPSGLAYDGIGHFWAADTANNRVLRYTSPSLSGASADVALGQKDFLQVAANTPASTGLYGPGSMAVSTVSGRLYVADALNNRVLWWNNFRSFTDGQAANGVLGQADFSSALPNRGGAAGPATLNYPLGVDVDAAENLWVADYGNNRVLRFANPSSNGQAADRVLGEPDNATTAGGTAQNLLLGPASVALDGAGKLWVADSVNNRVLRFNDFTADGTNADFVIGQAGYGTSASGTSINTLYGPSGVAVDPSGNVWVADTINSRVLEYTSLGAINPDAALVLGQADFNSSLLNTTQSGFNSPDSVVSDSAGNIWVGDTLNSRVLRFDAPFSSPDAALVLGQADFVSGIANRTAGALPGAATLSSPYAVSDKENNLWIADYGNNRVLKYATLYGTSLSPVFTGATATTLSASWNFVAGGYVVVLASDPGFTTVVSSASQGLNSAVFTGLAPDTNYYLEVKLAADPDAGFAANRVSSRTAVSPGTYLAPALTASSDTITATWTSMPAGNYTAVLALDAGFTSIFSSATVTGTNTAAYTGLTPDTSYYFEVKLSTDADTAYAVNTVSALTSSPVTLLAPALTVVSSTTINATWTAVPGNNYTVILALDSGFTSIVSYTVESAVGKSFDFLNPGTLYYFGVKLDTEPVTSLTANTVSARTNPGVTPLSPAFNSVSSTAFNASWSFMPGAQYVAVLAADSGYTSILSSGALTGGTTAYSGLTPFTPYYFEVKLSTEADVSYQVNRVSTQTLAPLTQLWPTLTAVSSNSLTAVWTNTGGTYVVALSSDPAFGTTISSVTQGINTASFNAGISGGNVYYLRVKLATESDAAYQYNTVSVLTPPTVTTLAPSLTAVSYDKVSASWLVLPNALYTAVLASDAGFTTIVSSSEVSSVPTVFTGLNPSTNYYFEVKLSTEAAASFAVNQASALTMGAPTPLAPTLTPVSATQLNGAWTNKPGATYVVVLASDTAYTSIIASGTLTGNTTSFIGLNGSRDYYMEVKLSTEPDVYFTANRVSARTLSTVTPLTPTLTAVSSTTLTASWTSFGPEYTAVLASDSGYTAIVASATAAGTTATYTGLSPNTPYYLEVKLSTEADTAYAANTASAKTLLPVTVLAPALTAVSSTTLNASWSALGSGYVAVLASDSGFGTIVASGPAAGNSASFTGLTPNVPYYLEVKVSTEADVSYLDNRTSAQTLLPVTALAPSLTAVSSTTLTANWSALGAGYIAVLASDSGFTAIVASGTATGNSATYYGLVPNTPYYLEVKVSTEADVSYLPNTASVQTRLPVTTLLPTLTSVSNSMLEIAWTGVAGSTYVVVLSTDSGFAVPVSSASQTANSKLFTGLTLDTSYYFQVKLSTEADASYASNTAVLRTLAEVLSVTGSTPDKVMEGPGSITMSITGAGFGAGSAVKLTSAGKPDINATSVTVASTNRLTVVMPKPTSYGSWNVVVTAGGQTVTLSDALVLLGADPGKAKIFQGIFKPGLGQAAQVTTSQQSAGEVSIIVYDNLGRAIKTLYKGPRSAGEYIYTWDGRNSDGKSVSSGVYLIRVEYPGFKSTKRVVVIK